MFSTRVEHPPKAREPRLRLISYPKPSRVVVDRSRWGTGNLYHEDRLDVLGFYCVASRIPVASFQYYSNLTYLRWFEGVTVGGPFVDSNEEQTRFETSAFQLEVIRANDQLKDPEDRELVLISLFRSIDVELCFEGEYL
jgi:hypothetical protein